MPSEGAIERKPALILGARLEWAVGQESCMHIIGCVVPFVFVPRLEFSFGEIGSRGFVLGALGFGPGFNGGSTPAVFLIDVGVKAGGTIAIDKADLLVGPRVSFDLGIRSEPANAGLDFQPYCTVGATIGVIPRGEEGEGSFVFMVEPGAAMYGGPPMMSIAVVWGGIF